MVATIETNHRIKSLRYWSKHSLDQSYYYLLATQAAVWVIPVIFAHAQSKIASEHLLPEEWRAVDPAAIDDAFAWLVSFVLMALILIIVHRTFKTQKLFHTKVGYQNTTAFMMNPDITLMIFDRHLLLSLLSKYNIKTGFLSAKHSEIQDSILLAARNIRLYTFLSNPGHGLSCALGLAKTNPAELIKYGAPLILFAVTAGIPGYEFIGIILGFLGLSVLVGIDFIRHSIQKTIIIAICDHLLDEVDTAKLNGWKSRWPYYSI